MADGNSQTEYNDAVSTTDIEMAGLIAAAVHLDPAKAILNALKTDVEANARHVARQEVDDLAEEVKRAVKQREEQSDTLSAMASKSVNPFAPVAPPPKPITWISEAVTAKEEMIAASDQDLMAAFTAPAIEPVREPAITPTSEDISVPAPSAPLPYTAPETSYEPPVAEPFENPEFDDDQRDNDVAAANMPALARGDGNWFGHSPEGLPIWLSTGVPVAAVSLFALGMAASGGFGAPEELAAPIDRPASVQTATIASNDGAIQPVLAGISLPGAAPSAVPSLVSPVTDADVSVTLAPSAATTIKTLPAAPIVNVSQTTPAQVGAAGSSIVFTGRELEASVEAPAETGLATAPSLKPEGLSHAGAQPERAVRAPARMAATPRRKVPVRMFSGRMAPGSAAHIVNELAQQSGPALTRTEQFWLARDTERVFENELDGRSVSLKSRQGQRVRVTMQNSSQIQREFTVMRASEMSALPHNMVLSGGWYAARRDVMLHAAPALNTGLKHRVLKRHAMIERMATYTDRYGDRWYLMGQRGLAVGFVSAGDVVLAGAYKGPLGDPYAASQGTRVHEIRTVYTTCRESFVGPEGGLVQRLNVCRDAEGHWVPHHAGQVSTRQASLAGPLLPKGGTASAIVLAEATGDPVAYHAFGNRRFRRRLQGHLTNARFGQTVEQVLPEGDLIRFTYGDVYAHEMVAPIKRVEALMAVSAKLRVDAGWMKAPIGAQLRASPDYLAEPMGAPIPAGLAVETMGHVDGSRNGEDWIMVGRSGVAFGYVPAAKLTEITGRVSPYALANVRTAAVADLVQTVSTCRTVAYETIEGTGQFDACQQADSSWALKTVPVSTRVFASTAEDLKTAP